MLTVSWHPAGVQGTGWDRPCDPSLLATLVRWVNPFSICPPSSRITEIVTGFFSELKSTSSGFASFDYEEAEYETSDLVKLNMMLNSKPVDALAMIVHRSVAQSVGRTWTKKLSEWMLALPLTIRGRPPPPAI
jgi:hypothetical protein